MKKAALPFALLISLLGVFEPAYAEALTKDQVQSLFTDKTFDGVSAKGRAFSIYFAQDGTADVAYADGKSASGKWYVTDDGQHCVSFSGCSAVFDRGEGVYHKLKDGVQTHTLKNARTGKQL